jgi:ferric-dicitrate binding protein FerR (iron transport regulator)
MQSQSDKQELIYKVLDSRATPTEKAELDIWITHAPANAALYEELRSLYRGETTFKTAETDERGGPVHYGLQNINDAKDIVEWGKGSTIEQIRTAGVPLIFATILLAALLYVIRRSASNTAPAEVPKTILLTGNLVFDRATLGQVFNALQSKTGVSIEAMDKKILLCPFSGAFYHGAAIEDVLKAIAETEGLQFSAGDGGYRLSGAGCSP